MNHAALRGEACESMIPVCGMQKYTDVMSAFAGSERYINHIWPASTDRCIDEVCQHLEKTAAGSGMPMVCLFDRNGIKQS